MPAPPGGGLSQPSPPPGPQPAQSGGLAGAISANLQSGVVNNLVGVGATGLSNAGLAQVQGGAAAIAIAPFLNLIAQGIKHPKWFDEDRWLIPVLSVLAFSISVLLWKSGIFGDVANDLQVVARAFLTAAQATCQSMFQYHALKMTDINVLKPVATGNEYRSGQ